MILKFLQGGALPLVSYTPVIISGGSEKTSSTTNDNKQGEDLTDKDLLEMISKLKGLPNESQKIIRSLQNFFIADPNPDSASIAYRYLSTLGLLQTASFNLEQFNLALDNVKATGGLNEVAVTSKGELLCKNEDGDFTIMLPEQLYENPNGYTPLTNYELLQYRAFDSSLAFDSTILNVVNNGIGISYVNDLIQKILDKIKSTSTTEEGYFSSNYLIQGIELLKSAMADGNKDLNYIYKYKITNKNLQQQIQEALKYIYKTLPQNVITLLKYKSDGTEKGVFNLLAQFVGSQHDIGSSVELDLLKNKDGEIQTSKSSKFELGPVGQLLADFGQKSNITIQTPDGNQWGINLNTTKHPITDKEGNSIGISTLDEVAESAFAGTLNFENVSMGGAIIDSSALSKVKINGTELHTGYLPIDIKRYHETGDIVPNYELLEKFNKVNKELEGVTDPDIINKKYVNEGLPLMYDEDGNIIITNYIKFGMINGVALSTAFKENVALSPYVTEVMDENEGNSVMRIINKALGLDYEEDWDPDNSLIEWFSTNPLYKGVIFIPLNTDYFTATSATGDKISIDLAKLIEAYQQAAQSILVKDKYVKPGQI